MITLSSINMRVDFFFFLNIFFYHIFIWIKQKIDIKKIQENVTLRGMRDHDDSFATGGPPAWWHRIPRSRQCFLARIWWIRWFITSSFYLIFLLFFFSFSFCISLIVFTSAGSINTWASGPLPPSFLLIWIPAGIDMQMKQWLQMPWNFSSLRVPLLSSCHFPVEWLRWIDSESRRNQIVGMTPW